MAKTKRVYFETHETTTVHKKGWVEIELDYTQFYHSLSKTLVQLDSLLSVKLLCWCFVEMSDKNMFTFNDLKAESLNDWLKKNNSKVYNKRSLYVALKDLIDRKIVLKWSNASYQVNPVYVWSDTIDKRIEHLKELGKYEQFQLSEHKV